MSFFTNPYLAAAQQPKQRQYQYATSPYAGNAYSDHLFATPHASYFGPSTVAAHTPSADIDEEEAIALAHLRAIQRRKETERLARQQAEREAVVAHLYEQQRAQAQAQAEARARAQLQAERQREAQAEAIRVHNEKIALAHYMRQMQIEAAQAQREEQYRRHQLSVLAAREQQQQAINEQRRRQCARNCAARRVQSSPSANNQAESHADVEAFNKWIGSLFGLQLPTESESGNKAESKAETNPVQSTPAPTPAPVAAAKPSEPAATTPTAAAEKKAEFPNAINDLLSSYLGLRVEPESKLGEAVSNKVPAGLNELLNQFGLEFFPDQPTQSETKEKKEEVAPTAESSTKSSAPAPAPVPAPIPAPAPAVAPAQSQSRSNGPVDLAEFLSGQHGLPPFIRDILGNVESAFKERSDPTYRDESVEGKGKGVADGEKKAPAPSSAAPADPAATPAPTVSPPTEPVQSTTAQSPPATANADGEPETEINASADSLARLESIASELQLATETFTFPSNLSFATTTNTDSAPSLLYNKQNKPYHAQNNKLLQLLLQADGVASNGDREVRRKRKQIVKLVEGHIEALERKRDEYWTEVKERREQTGEVSENESWSSGSTSDHEEAVQHVEDVAAESSQEQDTKSPAEKPSTFADAAKSTPVESAESSPAPNANTQAPTVVVEEVKKDVAEKKENEEGYELL